MGWLTKYPHDWQTTVLGELCDSETGLQTGPFGSQLHASDYTENGIPVVMPKDIGNYRVSTADIARIPDAIAYPLSRHMLLPGDILFARRGDIGRCALISAREEGWICGTGCLRARINHDSALPNYLIFYLDTPNAKSWLETNAVGQTMLNLNTSILAELPILLPPLPEQRKIAAILSTWDEAIALTEQLIGALQRRKQALMQVLLTGRVRFAEFEGSEWKEVRIGSFLKESRLPGSDGAKARKLTVKLYGKGVIPKDENKPGSENTVYHTRKAGQFIYSKLDFLNGAFGIIPKHLDGYETTLDLPTFEIAPIVDSTYFLNYVKREVFYKRFWGSARGGRKARRIQPSELLSTRLMMPKLIEQNRISEVITTMEEHETNLNEYLKQLQTQKRGLMQQLLTGVVRVEVEE